MIASKLAFAILFSLLSTARAEVHRLYDKAGPIQGHAEIVMELGPGDKVIMSSGKIFEIIKVLGRGESTRVFLTAEGQALRLPLAHDRITLRFLNEYIAHQATYAKAGIPVPGTIEAVAGEYVLVDKIDMDVTLEDLLKKGVPLTPAQEENLVKFAKSTWQLDDIGDFRPEQLGWDKVNHRWVLVDFSTPQMAMAIRSRTALDGDEFKLLSPNLKERISAVVWAEREKALSAQLDQLLKKSVPLFNDPQHRKQLYDLFTQEDAMKQFNYNSSGMSDVPANWRARSCDFFLGQLERGAKGPVTEAAYEGLLHNLQAMNREGIQAWYTRNGEALARAMARSPIADPSTAAGFRGLAPHLHCKARHHIREAERKLMSLAKGTTPGI